jgi:DNA-binding NarL/FixJ family response regulator
MTGAARTVTPKKLAELEEMFHHLSCPPSETLGTLPCGTEITTTPSMKSTATRILVVDDHPLVRHGLTSAIETQQDLCVVGEAESPSEVMDYLRETRPDVMLLDLNLKEGNGWRLLEDLSAMHQLVPTLVLSVNDELAYGRRLLKAGALGYLMKDAPIQEIFAAIRKVAAGELAVSPRLSRELVRHVSDRGSANTQDELEILSNRELQVSMFLIEGLSMEEISQRLAISAKTVSTYKGRLMKKLGVRTTLQLVAVLTELQAKRKPPLAGDG